MRNWRRNTVYVVLAALLILLQWHLWFEPDGMRDMLALRKLVVAQEAQNQELRKQNDEVVQQIKHLKKNQEATEGRARNELGMIKKGETFYQYVK